MQLKEMLHQISYTILQGSDAIEIHAPVYDSRKVKQNDLFVCITGFQTDGHRYIAMAIEKGASAILVEHAVSEIPEYITVIQTQNNRQALALLSANFYHHPANDMHMIGVTGTNGKTSITYLIRSVLVHAGRKTGVIGTIENRIGDRIVPTERTTPESLELQALLDTMRSESVTDVMMEVSSHSLDLHRVDGIEYDIGIFTNLTQDHLDYHKTMENYKIAKSLLFAHSKTSIINIDDPAGEFMISAAKGKVFTYAIDKTADLQASQIEIDAQGTKFILLYQRKQFSVSLHTPGRFSVYNALAAIGACLTLGISMDIILNGISSNMGITGRFQTIRSKKGMQAVVDYAHTPDGLENVLKTAQEFTKGKMIVVFGCGGDRDKTKRPIMGRIAGKYAGYCIITSDNPRTEDPEKILTDIEIGTKETNCPYEKQVDRHIAIQRAVSLAQAGDVILIAGKGHETYQIFPDRTIHFDDVEEVRNAFGEDCI